MKFLRKFWQKYLSMTCTHYKHHWVRIRSGFIFICKRCGGDNIGGIIKAKKYD